MLTRGRFIAPFATVCGLFLSLIAVGLPVAFGAVSTGCVLTFRHGGNAEADVCQDMGEAVAYRRFEGWVVVRKSALTSVEDETGTTRFNPPLTPEEERAQALGLPREGGVPIGPMPPEAAAGPPPQPPTVVYIPVPTAVPPQVVYQLPPPTTYYPAGFVFCRQCLNPLVPPITPPFVRIVPTSPSDIGPQAIQKTFPSISPIR